MYKSQTPEIIRTTTRLYQIKLQIVQTDKSHTAVTADALQTCWQVNDSNCTVSLVHMLSTFATGTTSLHTQVFRLKRYLNLKTR